MGFLFYNHSLLAFAMDLANGYFMAPLALDAPMVV
jgi:hypothetical protein